MADWLQARELGLAEGFTPALRERVITRCWDLGPQAYRLVTVAAVLPAPVDPAILGQVVGASGDVTEDLDRLVDQRLLLADGDCYRLRNPLVRQILGETFSTARRSWLLARARDLAEGTPRRRRGDAVEGVDGGVEVDSIDLDAQQNPGSAGARPGR